MMLKPFLVVGLQTSGRDLLDDAASLIFIAEMLRIWPYLVSIIFNEFQKKAGKSLIIHLRYSHIRTLVIHAKPGLIVIKCGLANRLVCPGNRPVGISGVVST